MSEALVIDDLENNQQPAVPEAHERGLDVELVICHNPESDLWKQAEAVEANTFIEKGYVDTKEEMDEEYNPYESASKMLIAKQGNKVVGCARVITYSPDVSFMTINDAAKGDLDILPEHWKMLEGIDPTTVMEIGTLSLEPEYRTRQGAEDHMVSSLYGAIYAQSLEHNTPYILASFDEKYLERFGGMYGPAVKKLGPPREYKGSNTIPVIMNTRDLEVYFESIGAQAYVDELVRLGNSAQHEF